MPSEQLDDLSPRQRLVQLPVLYPLLVFGVPEQVVRNLGQGFGGTAASRGVRNRRYTILSPKDLIHHRADSMHILIADLYEATAALRQQFPR